MSEVVGYKMGEGTALVPTFRDAVPSPDGKRYVVRTVHGDLQKNGNWIQVLTGGLGTLAEAAHYRTSAKLFTRSLGASSGYGSSALTFAHFNPLMWLPDSKRVAFLFSDGILPIQLISVNVVTNDVATLTHSSSDVVSFSFGGDDELIYSTKLVHPSDGSAELAAKGFVVKNDDIFSLLKGHADGYSILDVLWNSDTFIVTPTHPEPRKIAFNRLDYNRWIPLVNAKISPDGKYAVVDATPDAIPPEWQKYTNPSFQQAFREAERDRNGFSARFIKQLFVVDMDNATARPLWMAPDAFHVEIEWSPDSRSVLVGPTFTPDSADDEALKGRAVAEINIVNGEIRRLSLPVGFARGGVAGLRWADNHTVEVDDGETRFGFIEKDGLWLMASNQAPSRRSRRITIEQQQDLNTPPTLYAIDNLRNRKQPILELDPQFKRDVQLGRVEEVNWTDGDGRRWNGLLYYPVHFRSKKRFPLVIQTHGYAPSNTFSLYGEGFPAPGLGPSFSVFAAQALANRDIAVLQMEDKELAGIDDTPKEPTLHAQAYEAAIEHFVDAGLVAADKVGLVGFSRTGWHVEYALTHSKFRYAAAIVADNFDGSYLQELLSDAHAEFEQTLGAPPFGPGLSLWFERAPGFGADRVSTPLRLEIESGGITSVLTAWEMFSRLKQLGKPVELYVVPDVEHGSHGLQNPAQCLAAQQGAVDWFDFWLNQREAPDPSKREQYDRWRSLRALTQP